MTTQEPKNTAVYDSHYVNLAFYKAEALYEGRLKVILQLQVISHFFEPTFIILILICKTLPDQSK